MTAQDSCINYEAALKEKGRNRRRSSIFKPNEAITAELDTDRYPPEYKQKLIQEFEKWNEALEDARSEYFKTKSKQSNNPVLEIDRSILNPAQLDLLGEEPSCETYLKAVQDFYTKLSVYKHFQDVITERAEVDEQILKSKIQFMHDQIIKKAFEQ